MRLVRKRRTPGAITALVHHAAESAQYADEDDSDEEAAAAGAASTTAALAVVMANTGATRGAAQVAELFAAQAASPVLLAAARTSSSDDNVTLGSLQVLYSAIPPAPRVTVTPVTVTPAIPGESPALADSAPSRRRSLRRSSASGLASPPAEMIEPLPPETRRSVRRSPASYLTPPPTMMEPFQFPNGHLDPAVAAQYPRTGGTIHSPPGVVLAAWSSAAASGAPTSSGALGPQFAGYVPGFPGSASRAPACRKTGAFGPSSSFKFNRLGVATNTPGHIDAAGTGSNAQGPAPGRAMLRRRSEILQGLHRSVSGPIVYWQASASGAGGAGERRT